MKNLSCGTSALCGANCSKCPSKELCPGCAETNGCPFGKQCVFAKYILDNGIEAYRAFKRRLIDEINQLGIEGMAPLSELYPLVGQYVNLEYPLPSGKTAKLLRDDEMYLGAQVEKSRENDGNSTCFGVIARESFILICEYGENGINPEIVLYKKR